MKIHEYQGKEILERYGVRTQKGIVADSSEAAGVAWDQLGGELAVVKAQIHAGGRGKGGGVKLVRSREECVQASGEMLGMMLKTHQTAPEGQKVQKVFVAEGLDLVSEFYVGLALDRQLGKPVLMISAEGGVEIETLAQERPEALLKLAIDPALGLQQYQARRAAFFLGLKGETVKKAAKLLSGLCKAYLELDCELAEINPLVLTEDGELCALDAKMNFDSNALYRHPDIAKMRDEDEEDPKEVEASKFGLNYIVLEGSIGCMVNGAGLAMATMDTIKLHGASPANFLDVGGGANEEAITQAFRIILSDPNVEGILVNIFGGIMKCDVIARGVIGAARTVELSVPLVVRLEGTNVQEGRQLLADSGLPITSASSLDEGAQLICEAVATANA
ncbi:MAG TPA: ADP-forming succinate--CoA ligase subunit beta [Planctomycetota bacterium]|jgi:succinyl-CoA synthetase beta subunit|nr:ADP-forming succinate--CoA ligase subunit beta [Planctomycetota bacterium]MDP7246496.1 ADP-forming succinate--CoA ligase subunit beta [Planctomycetota bacterium]HJM40273.1 ADP-forming succinate--CoA ligase subunit beta [Planctomycetota bacterium]|tara:strand:- start:18667 stop:19839 length:1173 start_codon:yes stop_codon:yes gene_type:complete